MPLDIDAISFITFLVVTLFIGFRYGRNVKTINDYALGGRNFSTSTLVFTLLATWVTGSSFMIILQKTYTDGLTYLISLSCMPISFFITAFILIPRMQEFLGQLSVGETMGKLYGKNVKLITAVAGVLSTAGMIAVQFKAFANVFHYVLGIDPTYAVVISGVITTLYSAFGGIRSVTFTDVFQTIAFSVSILGISIIIWNHSFLYNLDFSKSLDNTIFDYKILPNKLPQLIPLMLYFCLPGMSPVLCQRVFMGSNLHQVKKVFAICAVILVVIHASIAWIPFLIFNIDQTLESNQLLPYVLENFASPHLKIGIIICVAAMVMSSADSLINASAVLFAHDFCKPLNMKINELYLSKFFSIVLGLISILLALNKGDLLSIVLFGMSFYLPVVTVPLILAILGFRSTTRAVLIGMGAGLTTVLYWMWNMKHTGIDAVMPGTIANLIFFMGSHYILGEKGGWVGIKNPEYLNSLRQERRRKWKKFVYNVKNFCFIKFCKNNTPKEEYIFCIFGAFSMIALFSNVYVLPHITQVNFPDTIDFVLQSVVLCSAILLSYPLMPQALKDKHGVVSVAWVLMVFYILILASGFLVFLSNFAPFTLMMFVMNLIIANLLLRVRNAFILTIIGIFITIKFYGWYIGDENLSLMTENLKLKIVYILLILSTFVITFMRPREKEYELKDEFNLKINNELACQKQDLKKALNIKEEILQNIQHETSTPLTSAQNLTDSLIQNWDTLDKDKQLEYLKMIQQSNYRSVSYVNDLQNLAKFNANEIKLNYSKVDLNELIEETIEECKKFYLENKDINFNVDIPEITMIKCDKDKISRVMHHLIKNAICYSHDGTITITTTETTFSKTKGLSIEVKDQGIGIPDDQLVHIFDVFFQTRWTKSPAQGRGIGLTISKKIIEAHGGIIQASNNDDKGTTIQILIPYL